MAKYKEAFPKLPERGWFAKGDKGEEVKKLQRLLNWLNAGRIVDNLVVDGEIGNLTISAVSFYEEVHTLTIDGEFGEKCLKLAKMMDMCGRWRALNWAISVAKDNRFTYGAGERGHRSGCYFCGTNTGPRMKKKERKGEPHVVYDKQGNGHTYERTYCCNTFATAAYAHGANDKKTLAYCKAGTCFGMKPKEWETSPNFKRLGKCSKVPYDKLIPGDVIMNNNSGKDKVPGHVWIFAGAGRVVEAANGGWGTESIRVTKDAKRRYNQYAKSPNAYVVRYYK